MTAPRDASSVPYMNGSVHEPNGLISILEGTIRELVRQEVSAALAALEAREKPTAPGGRWMTPPRVARELGISERAVRNMIKEGVVKRRLRNVSQTPTQPKYLVNIDEVAAVAARDDAGSHAPPVSIEEEARRILSARDAGK